MIIFDILLVDGVARFMLTHFQFSSVSCYDDFNAYYAIFDLITESSWLYSR